MPEPIGAVGPSVAPVDAPPEEPNMSAPTEYDPHAAPTLDVSDRTITAKWPWGQVVTVARTPANEQLFGVQSTAPAQAGIAGPGDIAAPSNPMSATPTPTTPPPLGGLGTGSATETPTPGAQAETPVPAQKSPLGGLGLIGQGFKETLSATTQEATASEHLHKVEADRQTARAAALDQARAADQARLADIQKNYDTMMSKQQTDEKAIADRKVDPDHFFKERGTGARVLAGISMALGAFGSALTGGPNMAMQIIHGAIDRDIDAQKHEIAKAKDILQLRGNRIAEYMRHGMNMMSAEQATRLLAYQSADAKAMSSTATIQQKEWVRAQLAQKIGQLKMGFGQALLASAAASQPKLDQQLKLRALEVQLPGEKAPRQAKSPERAKDASGVVQNWHETQAALTELEDLVKNKWQSMPIGDAKLAVNGIVNGLIARTGSTWHLGVLGEGDKTFANQIGDPTSWTQGDPTTLNLINRVRARSNTALHSMVKTELQ